MRENWPGYRFKRFLVTIELEFVTRNGVANVVFAAILSVRLLSDVNTKRRLGD